MSVAFDDIETGIQGRAVKHVGKLAKASPDAGDETALSKFASIDIAFPGAGASQLLPEAEGGVGGNFGSVEGGAGDPQVLDLSCGEREFCI